ncbi:MAG: mandelate racemase/muconate lactonizing enzyme family protein [Planctomycetes bacterium]|nr:mandelate racemase/muconate lactonizing enzyme family protein [Planctomycetota bacterium]
MNRRQFIKGAASAGAAGVLGGSSPGAEAPALPAGSADAPGILRLGDALKSPVKVASIEVLEIGGNHFIRSRSADGAAGVAMTNERIAYLLPILQQLVIPYFIGEDARDLESLIGGVYRARSNYKLAGLAFWNPVGWVEFSLLDLLGRAAGRSVGDLLGGVVRREVAVYMSSMRRDTTPEAEVEWVGRRLAETGAGAVKLKVGGRMSRNADAAPGRSEKLAALARRTFGDKMTIYVDANGSYDSARAIEVGRMLESHGVAFFEEPCPFEELEETKRAADALAVPVAGGEQDASIPRFDWMIRNRVVDVVQPDVNYNGGFVRTLQVARLAAAAGMPITPHNPATGFREAYVVHFASVVPGAGPFMEYNAAPARPEPWLSPALDVKNGVIQVPPGPGLGLEIDPAYLAKAKVVGEK